MSQRSHTFRASRTSRVSGNYMASRPSLAAAPATSGQPPRQRESIVVVISDDDDDDEPPQRSKSSAPAPAWRQPPPIVDLTGEISSRSPSPPRSRPAADAAPKGPVPRIRSPLTRSPLPPLTRASSQDEQAPSPLPPLTRDSSPDDPTHRVREEVATKQAFSPQMKISPQSLQNQRKETPSSRRQTARQKQRPSTPQLSDENDDEDDDGPLPQNFQPSPGTPSKQASSRGHRKSQKSADSSINSSSPLLTRLKQRRNSTQVNGAAKPCGESPKETLSRRTMSSKHISHEDPLTQEQLETSLEAFESKLKDEHAFGMRWLLQDVRETLADRKSSFFEAPFVEKAGFSPWASESGVQVGPGHPTGDAPHVDKLDSFVSLKIRPDYKANMHRSWPRVGLPRRKAS
jgi:hypothetical protein